MADLRDMLLQRKQELFTKQQSPELMENFKPIKKSVSNGKRKPERRFPPQSGKRIVKAVEELPTPIKSKKYEPLEKARKLRESVFTIGDYLVKGKALPVGTIRTRENGDFIKTATKWAYLCKPHMAHTISQEEKNKVAGIKTKVAAEQDKVDKINKKAEKLIKEVKEVEAKHKKKPIPKGTGKHDLNGFEIVQQLGGSTGAMLVKKGGKLYVKKTGNSLGHMKNEIGALKVYKELGIRVPNVAVVDSDFEKAFYMEYVEGQTLKEWWSKASMEDKKFMKQEIAKGFVADALLANHDVIGMESDNIIIDSQGRPVRIDVGGSMSYRAQGGNKESWTGDNCDEIDTMRDKKINSKTAAIFGHLTDEDITEQVGNLQKKASGTIKVWHGEGVHPNAQMLGQRWDIVHAKYDPAVLLAKKKAEEEAAAQALKYEEEKKAAEEAKKKAEDADKKWQESFIEQQKEKEAEQAKTDEAGEKFESRLDFVIIVSFVTNSGKYMRASTKVVITDAEDCFI